MHYHGTSMTIMQFPTEDNKGEQVAYPTITLNKSNTKKVQSLPPSYVETTPIYLPTGPLYAPKCKSITDKYSNNEIYLQERLNEIAWLDETSSNKQANVLPKSWSKYHAEKERVKPGMNGINVILPLIPKPVHTLETQYHCMQITKNTIAFLNPNQTPIDVCDQPVYALTKEIQIRKPDIFGSDRYFSLLGGLHVEHCLLSIHGELVKGSGLYEILANNNLSIIGTGAVVNANHIKQARYCLQVAVCAVYAKLKEASVKNDSTLTPFQWLQEHKNSSQMCFYWDIIINLQIDILLYIRAIRESNFQLYVLCLKHLIKWFFAMDHYHYARWCTVHLMDLIQLEVNCPDVYREFSNGNFSFQKTVRQFSKMAPDQLHEQNNEVIKGTSGATHLLNRQDKSGLERWELCGHEISRIVTEFESAMNFRATGSSIKKHHEDTPAFQKRFSSDVKKVLSGIIYNPFEQENLTKINNTNVTFIDTVFKDLSSLIDTGEKQFHTFWNDRLITAEVPLNRPIKKNSFLILGKFEEQKAEKKKKLVYPNDTMNKLRSAMEVRKQEALRLFEKELFGVAQSLAETSTSLYHGNKSEILKKFHSFTEYSAINSSAVVIDLSPLIKGMDVTHCKTFQEFANALYKKVACYFKDHKRIDLIVDRYFKDSLKENLRDERGIGSRFLFDDNTKLPVKFHSDFLRNSDNKNEIGHYLAKKLIELHLNPNQILVVTYEHTVLATNSAVLTENSITNCTSEEADQRIIRHVLNLSQITSYSDILACTYDTDVLMLLVAYAPCIQRLNEINFVCQFGFGKNVKYYSINDIVKSIGKAKCKALPFFHAFSGCDTVSSFFNHGKTRLWDSWIKNDHEGQLTEVFQVLSNKPEEILDYHIDVIENYIKAVYYPNSKNLGNLDIERFNHFLRQSDPNLRLIPPSRNGLIEHTKRAALQGGWIWAETQSNVEYQNPELWGWRRKDGRFLPNWEKQNESSVDIANVIKTCICQKAICGNCKCAKNKLQCLPYCGCQKKCKNEY